MQCAPVLNAGADTELESDNNYSFILTQQLTTCLTFFQKVFRLRNNCIFTSPYHRIRASKRYVCASLRHMRHEYQKCSCSRGCVSPKTKSSVTADRSLGFCNNPKTHKTRPAEKPPTLELRPPGFARDPSLK